ncbi:MAG TPA: prohibitin family protein [Smithellaceae bacterium]|jgi:regulator of protease activity HflC (stomatin/prohibitin superfamily)|nr:prohibitin family protein [Smithellaceae bacterium]HQF84340.1 prohibitin family protein [Smithellaceae bacterium]HQG80620.1 prohibitin family protein [Smithellaceae bacterium]
MNGQKIPGKMAGIVIAAIVIFFLIIATYFGVDAGERGVVLRFGEVNRVVEPGPHFKIPLAEEVVFMSVRVEKTTTKTEAASRDLQTVQTTMVLNYNLDPAKAGSMYANIGLNYNERVIDPALKESFKAAAARYTAEELISKRETLKTEVRNYLRDRLGVYGIVVVDLSITDFEFSAEFNKAIESKQTAEQNALRAKRDLERIKVEAEQKITSAKAEAEALRLQRQVISPELIQLRKIEAQIKAIEKWDGKMPNVTGGAVPFIQIDK